MIELISQAGKPHTEREIEKVYRMIHKEPGILKSDLMRRNHLRTAQLRDIIETLMDRGLIDAKKVAQGTRYTSVV
jgi:predicted transcriptional regulator